MKATTLGQAIAIGLALLTLQTANARAEEREVNLDDRSIVSFDPKYQSGEIVVSFADRRLYHVQRSGSAVSYPIAVPRSQSRWSGVERISMKRVNPSWTPTPEMRRENPRLPTWVPGGHPMNPLGVRGLYLGQTTYRIHGTDAPWTIGQDVSKGCIRMLNEHVIELYDRTPVGAKVTATWDSFQGRAGKVVRQETTAGERKMVWPGDAADRRKRQASQPDGQ